MSRTDVHQPVWVQIRDRVPGVRITHDHRFGPCDFTWEAIKSWHSRPRWAPGRGSWCDADLPFYGWPNTKHYGNAHHHKSCKNQYHRRERARWQVLKSKLLRHDPWDVENELGFRPRGSVRWDEW